MHKVTEELLSLFKALRKRSPAAAAKIVVSLWIAFLLLAVPFTTHAASTLGDKEARKLIALMPGFQLKTKAVHVSRIAPVDATTAEATAEIDMAFALEQNDRGQWRVAEIRTGQDAWEGIDLILAAIKGELNASACDLPEPPTPEKLSTDLSFKRARCVIANLLGVQLPSDAVRIKSVSGLELPLNPHQSALVEARIEAKFRLAKDKSSWRVTGVRTGAREWIDPAAILNEVNKEKTARAQTDLQSIAKALEDFRGKRGFYVESKSEAVLIDFLSPGFLSRVIRFDPWHRPYRYEGTRDHFTLSSSGPDGKENTGDDIVLNGPKRSAQTTNRSSSSDFQ